MARRTFDVIDICEIFTHWHAGRSKNEIAASLGLSRNTVRKYMAAESAGMAPGGPAVSPEPGGRRASKRFTRHPAHSGAGLQHDGRSLQLRANLSAPAAP
jgi:predicted transcriptional regulator